MLRIFAHITSHIKEYLVLSVLSILSIFLMASGNSSKSQIIRSIAVEIVGRAKSITSIIPNIYNLKAENEELRRKNMTLLDEISKLREEKLENIRLRRMLGFKERRNDYELLPANVVGKNLTNLRNYIVLNLGSDDGVKVNMPVISESGVVGKISDVGKRYCVAMLLFHEDFRASVKIQRSRVDGILGWDGGKYLSMLNVPKTMDVQLGDVVITSEYSTIFPPGYEVGVVVEIDDSQPGLFKGIKIKPSVDFVKLEEVFVLKYLPDEERVEIERRLY